MNTDNYDIYFPHLGIGVEHLGNSISVFGFRIAYYGIIIGIGMLMGVLIASFDYKRRGQKSEDIEDLALYSIIFAILGARAYYVIFEWDQFFGPGIPWYSGRSSTSGRAVSPSMAAS